MRVLPLTLLLLSASAPSGAAQARWSVTLERGATTYSETAHDSSSPPAQLLPWHPALYTLRLTRQGARFGVGLSVAHASGQVAGRVGSTTLLVDEGLDLNELAAELSLVAARTGNGAELRLHAGPLLDRWSPEGADARWTYGGQAGASLTAPVTARLALSLRGDVAVTTNEARAADFPPDVTRAGTLRRGRAALGITWTP
ncbi:MAG TPA: hypothetical protein VFI13_11010 [Gemmatimonadales bacterium]|nr:hypothetical protein [Gemmatimonadales bacterium]